VKLFLPILKYSISIERIKPVEKKYTFCGYNGFHVRGRGVTKKSDTMQSCFKKRCVTRGVLHSRRTCNEKAWQRLTFSGIVHFRIQACCDRDTPSEKRNKQMCSLIVSWACKWDPGTWTSWTGFFFPHKEALKEMSF
jgi:hypothetical protein